MPNIPKKVSERFQRELPRFQKILQAARDRDINEADTSTIVQDLLSDLFGFDKYHEVTKEYCIRSTYCDLAIKVDSICKYLVEVKGVGSMLKAPQVKQAVDYAANQGVDWVILTNGIVWQVFKVTFERPIGNELVCEINMLDLNSRKLQDHERLYLICREGLGKAAIEEFHDHRRTVNKYTISALLVGEVIVDMLRKEMKKIAPGLHVDAGEVEKILREEVIKREILDGENAQKAAQIIRKSQRRKLQERNAKAKASVIEAASMSSEVPTEEIEHA